MKGRSTLLAAIVILTFVHLALLARDVDVVIRGAWPSMGTPRQPIHDTAAVGNYYFTISGLYGVSVFDFTDPERPRQLPDIQSEGLPRALTIVGNYLYVVSDIEGLRIVDISDPSKPTVVGALPIQGNAQMIAVAGGYAYINVNYEWVRIVDVRNPVQPKISAEIGRYAWPNSLGRFVLIGNHLFLGNKEVFDVSDPTTPRLVRTFEANGELKSSGSLLLVNWMTTLSIYDATDALNPKLVGTYQSLAHIQRPAAVGNRYFFHSHNAIYVVDFSDPTAPRLAGEYALTNSAIGGFAPTSERVYVTTRQSIDAVDIRDPGRPTLLGRHFTASGIRTAVLAGPYVLATDPLSSPNSIHVLDLSNLTNPVRVAHIETTRLISELSVVGRHGYVSFFNGSTGERSLGVIDLTDMRNPRLVTETAHTNNFWSLNLVNNYVVGLSPAGLTTLDLSAPLEPRQVTTFPTSTYISQLVVQGSRAYVAGGDEGLYVVDLLNPASPQLLGRFRTNRVIHLDVRGSHAFVAAADQMLVIDVANPTAMKVVGAFKDEHRANTIRIYQDTAYVAGGSGTAVLDITNPAQPALKFRSTMIGAILDFAPPYFIQLGNGKLEIAELAAANPQTMQRTVISQEVWDVALAGRYAYLASPQTNIQILDIAESNAPRKVGEIPVRAGRLHVHGRHLYATDSLFQIIDISDPLNPALRGSLNEKVHSVGVYGNYAYAGTDYRQFVNHPYEFLVINITNKAAPFVTARMPGVEAVTLQWPYAYVGGAGIGVIDVSIPSEPEMVGSFGGFGTANEQDVAVARNYLYSVGPFGFHVTDVSDPQNPTWLGTYQEHGFRGRRVQVAGSYAYVIDSAGLLHVFDVSRPAQPRRVGGNVQANPPGVTFNVLMSGYGLFAAADTLYVASQNEFAIMDVFRPDANALRITSLQPILPGASRLRLSGPVNTPIQIESTMDFETWSLLQSHTLREIPFDVADTNAESATRFYRLRSP